MNDRINLKKDGGPVVFLGSMNAMPMMYAIELREQGVEVLYFVDAHESNTLSRPENHFPEIEYPYPDWIKEVYLPTAIILPLFRKLSSLWIRNKIHRFTNKAPQAYILNGFFCTLAPFLEEKTQKVFLTAGSDLDTWADEESAERLSVTFKNRSIFKYLPRFVAKPLIKNIVHKQFSGAISCNKTLYFPEGFNEAGDRVTARIKASGRDVIPRYDISFRPLKNTPRGIVNESDKLVIFSGVRFLFKTFPDGNLGYNKGNDLIIKGIAEFYNDYKNIEVHLVEKGEDVKAAKQLCSKLGLDSVVVWHKEMKFKELLALYVKADVCFDQVGMHWISAIGSYALWLGKPLIANDERAVKSGLWSSDSPILSASTSEEVTKQLIRIKEVQTRHEISKRSMKFAEDNLGPRKIIQQLFLIKE